MEMQGPRFDEMQPSFSKNCNSKSETQQTSNCTSSAKIDLPNRARSSESNLEKINNDFSYAGTEEESQYNVLEFCRSPCEQTMPQVEATHFNKNSVVLGNQNCLDVNAHESVGRKVSSLSLCSWSSFDTNLTDENLSDNEDYQGSEKTEPLTFTIGKKKNLWGQVRKAIHWSPFVQNYKKKYPWVQLAGHDGSFKAGENGTILKKAAVHEIECLCKLMQDVLRPYVPEYKGQCMDNGESFTQMEDLLADFDSPSVMDCKMGIRTYQEAELIVPGNKQKIRKDLYEKMIAIDPMEPTEEENSQQGITKPRYMQWREKLSSTATLGFRIEGIKNSEKKPCKDFKKTRSKTDVGKVFSNFIDNRNDLQEGYLQRLKAIRATLDGSPFFSSHEVIGSSLLFVHDSTGKTGVWLIDFGKTTPVPENMKLNHREEWREGNREDGYLIGLDNMIEIWGDLFTET